MALIRRLVKGQALTSADHDANIDHFEKNPNGIFIPKAGNVGIKIDPDAPDWGWKDLIGQIHFEQGTLTTPDLVQYQGVITQRQFDVGDLGSAVFHIPHDYAPGTDMFIHVHWSHTSSLVTSGGVDWHAEAMYAKGFDQGAFTTPLAVHMPQDASTIRYQHMIAESPLSTAGGTGGILVTENLEVDGLIIVELSLESNTMDGGAKPFFHTMDIHYQSTNVATKQKAPDFYT